MKSKQILKLLYTSIISLLCFLPTYVFSNSLSEREIKTFRNNIVEFFVAAQHFEDDNTSDFTHEKDSSIKGLIDSVSDDGSWSYIDYKSKQRSGWEPRKHLDNMLVLASAYRDRKSPYYLSKDVLKIYKNSLNYWLKADCKSLNWWHAQIGTPKTLAPSLILMGDALSKEEIMSARRILNVPKIGNVGQNRVWLAGNVFFRGVLYNIADDIALGSDEIKKQICVKLGDEGIQADDSFHQHGPQQQFGNYGLSYLADMSKWAKILNKTSYEFDKNQMLIIRNYILKGVQWVLWKGSMDVSSCGRQLANNAEQKKCSNVYDSVKVFMSVDTRYKSKYQKFLDYKSLVGHNHFWCSDYTLNRTAERYFTLKMCSTRVVGAESCNDEHLKGYYSGDGVALLYQTGKEYSNIAPFWNWRKLPGTTIAQSDDEFKILSWRGYHLKSDFVGGVSNGKNGVSAMRYTRDGVDADKSWFVFDNMILALGSGVKSSTENEITTSVNQLYSTGDIVTSKGKVKDSMKSNNIAWVWHSNTGYIFPNGGNIEAKSEKVEGSWSEISARLPKNKLSADIFTLWINHGIKPENDKYVYAMLPNVSVDELKKINANFPYKITNKNDLQIVEAKDLSIGGAVCYKACEIDLLGGIKVSQPVIIMYEKIDNTIKLSVSDPTAKLESVSLNLKKYTFNGKPQININLSQGGDAGSSIEVTLDKR